MVHALAGEIHESYIDLKEGILKEEGEITELGNLICGKESGRKHDNEITICDLTGVGVQDTAFALFAHKKASADGLGKGFNTQE